MGKQRHRRKIRSYQLEGVELLSPWAAAEETGYNEQYLRRLARQGEIPGAQIVGNRWFFEMRQLKKFLCLVLELPNRNSKFSDEDILDDPLIGFV